MMVTRLLLMRMISLLSTPLVAPGSLCLSVMFSCSESSSGQLGLPPILRPSAGRERATRSLRSPERERCWLRLRLWHTPSLRPLSTADTSQGPLPLACLLPTQTLEARLHKNTENKFIFDGTYPGWGSGHERKISKYFFGFVCPPPSSKLSVSRGYFLDLNDIPISSRN